MNDDDDSISSSNMLGFNMMAIMAMSHMQSTLAMMQCATMLAIDLMDSSEDEQDEEEDEEDEDNYNYNNDNEFTIDIKKKCDQEKENKNQQNEKDNKKKRTTKAQRKNDNEAQQKEGDIKTNACSLPSPKRRKCDHINAAGHAGKGK
ncbi:hypothetical protein FisN_2HuN28 [Fistulifera solaris]|uniref:Uncharacterized protein n=1 Tax=Fistulifera solaris TaxID=1519565 RepID=A0A1Z5JI69_FISSO|nr:hypothetical protein FisN_2HuN28 [Fistulifera solaris]|eukprot:GAX13705.1 hypothetical protein FisN_2HuN28 [Fistulifera solaris]